MFSLFLTGRDLAVATSDAHIRLFDPDLHVLKHSLDGSTCGAGISLVPDNNGFYPEFIRMSFGQSGDIMVATATDGLIRLWQLWPDLTLLHLAAQCIKQHTNTKDIIRLPLPKKLVLYLLGWPT